jgi:hypothetical protein
MTIDVTKEIKTDELRHNDIVTVEPNGHRYFQPGSTVTVRTIDRKVKWTTVVIAAEDWTAPLTRRVLGDELWTVVRTEKTDAEKAAEHRALIVEALERSYASLQLPESSGDRRAKRREDRHGHTVQDRDRQLRQDLLPRRHESRPRGN